MILFYAYALAVAYGVIAAVAVIAVLLPLTAALSIGLVLTSRTTGDRVSAAFASVVLVGLSALFVWPLL